MSAGQQTGRYPEHEKLARVRELSQALGEFLDVGLPRLGFTLCRVDRDSWSEPVLVPAGEPVASILARYFEIDQAKLDAEKDEMLAVLRSGS